MLYEFKGKHFIASLYDVKEITNLDKLRNVFETAIKESGATILGKTEHVFSDGGFTCVWLLSESHCSIHTYVEQKKHLCRLFFVRSRVQLEKIQ